MNEVARNVTRYNWQDYRSWDDGHRWEIIGGEIFDMSAAPTTRHQWVSQELGMRLGNHFADKDCRVFPAPTDLKLSDEDIVQPDLLVICEKSKIKPTHIEGAPTLVIEILSASTTIKDRGKKMDLYARSGVREVWIVSPYPSLVEVFLLDGDTYRWVHAYEKESDFSSPTFPEMLLDLRKVFGFPLDPGEEIKVVKEAPPPRYQAQRA